MTPEQTELRAKLERLTHLAAERAELETRVLLLGNQIANLKYEIQISYIPKSKE